MENKFVSRISWVIWIVTLFIFVFSAIVSFVYADMLISIILLGLLSFFLLVELIKNMFEYYEDKMEITEEVSSSLSRKITIKWIIVAVVLILLVIIFAKPNPNAIFYEANSKIDAILIELKILGIFLAPLFTVLLFAVKVSTYFGYQLYFFKKQKNEK